MKLCINLSTEQAFEGGVEGECTPFPQRSRVAKTMSPPPTQTPQTARRPGRMKFLSSDIRPFLVTFWSLFDLSPQRRSNGGWESKGRRIQSSNSQNKTRQINIHRMPDECYAPPPCHSSSSQWQIRNMSSFV